MSEPKNEANSNDSVKAALDGARNDRQTNENKNTNDAAMAQSAVPKEENSVEEKEIIDPVTGKKKVVKIEVVHEDLEGVLGKNADGMDPAEIEQKESNKQKRLNLEIDKQEIIEADVDLAIEEDYQEEADESLREEAVEGAVAEADMVAQQQELEQDEEAPAPEAKASEPEPESFLGIDLTETAKAPESSAPKAEEEEPAPTPIQSTSPFQTPTLTRK